MFFNDEDTMGTDGGVTPADDDKDDEDGGEMSSAM